jgi:hypothetical protein
LFFIFLREFIDSVRSSLATACPSFLDSSTILRDVFLVQFSRMFLAFLW